MSSTARRLAKICLLTVVVTVVSSAANAQEPFTLSTHDLNSWVAQFPVPGSRLEETTLARLFLDNEEIRPFFGQSAVGLGINGRVQFTSERGFVRIVAVDDQLHEYLVYEVYALIAPSDSFQILNACRETCLLPPTVPSVLKVEIVDASVDIQTIVMNQLMTTAGIRLESAAQTTQQIQDIKAAQEAEIIEVLNRQIKAKGLKWIAGETAISRLSYAEKKSFLACTLTHPDTPPNLQGAEYYKGGIINVTAATATALGLRKSSALIDSFDWRSRHGATKPGSPYYDGDATGGGWMTSVKSQRCADCWAHSALGATEALANLYLNQHLDLDLSEQELVSCSGAGSCQFGGNTGAALSYVQRVGVVDETCFPESGLDQSCGNCCTTPSERVMIAGFEAIYPSMGEDNIKRRLMTFGPLPFGISSWWHTMVLAGYTTEMGTGDTVWILKNSWGSDWGDHGYGYLIVSVDDIYLTYNLHNPVSLLTSPTVACRDADGDGYFNWGISSTPPLTCGNVPSVADCDDSDSTVALMTEAGACTAPPRTTAPSAVSVTPSSGSGAGQTFSYLFSDPDGFADINWTLLLVNGSPSLVNGCSLLFLRAADAMWLLNDAGTVWQGPVTLGSNTTLQNSQCSVDAAGSSSSGVGTELTVNVALLFKSAFAGQKTHLMLATDNANQTSNWQTGTYDVTGSPPTVTSVTPASGSGLSQTFSYVFADPNGFTDIAWAAVLINDAPSAVNSCVVFFDRGSSGLLLLNDSASAWLGPTVVGSGGTLQNSQCAIDSSAAYVSGSGTNLTLNLAVSFNQADPGVKFNFAITTDLTNQPSNWQLKGTWTVD